MFNRLGKEQITKIVDIELAKLTQRLSEKKYTLVFTEKLKSFLSESGYDPSFGARPLKRTIQNFVQNPLAKLILSGKFAEGDEISADYDGSEVVFRGKRKKQAG